LIALLLTACQGPGVLSDNDVSFESSQLDADAELEEWAGPLPCMQRPADPWELAAGDVPNTEHEPCVLPVPTEMRCDNPVPIFEDGDFVGDICPQDAEASGLTVVDLSEQWAPRVLGGSDELGHVPYRDVYLKLARQEFEDHPRWDRARGDRFLELYGIFPTPEVVFDRLADADRHQCHAGIEHRWLPELDERGIDTWRNMNEQRGDAATVPALIARLRDTAEMLELGSVDELAHHPEHGAYYKRFLQLSARVGAVAEMQQHLRCEGLLEAGREGLMDTSTIDAMQLYHRLHMVVSWQLDKQTAAVLMSNSRELDFLTLLRMLRERVVDATGLLADGTAAGVTGKVVGYEIDTPVFLTPLSDEPLADAARDRIAEATDAAARALSWTSPDDALAFVDEYGIPPVVAVRLPPRPYYHREHMELRVEIDRGDVWYDFPFASNGDRAYQPRERRPSLVVYADTETGSIPLVRWPTTVGSWKPERLADNRVKLVYKESPVGSRIYRDIVAGPRWIPPHSTPERDLMRPRGHGRWVPRHTTFGPDYASAYGLVMLIHHRVDGVRDGETVFTDQGIRSHGSVSYASILDGFSHGCHRLHNHRAVRLSGYLLAHRNHEVRGAIPLHFSRSIYWRNRRHRLTFESRGFRYELTPPVEVNVLRGRIFGRSSRPLAPRGLTRPMLKRYGM